MSTVRCLLTVASLLALAAIAGAKPVQAVPAEYTTAIQPQVALGDDGSVHLTFGQGGSVYYTRSKDGVSFAQPVLVGTLEKLALGMRRGPRVTVTRALILITAISHADGNLHAWTSVDGSKWQENPALNGAANSAREGLHALAGDGRGRIAAVWLDLRTGKTSLWGNSLRTAGPIGAKTSSSTPHPKAPSVNAVPRAWPSLRMDVSESCGVICCKAPGTST